MGFRFRLYPHYLPGKPDMVLPRFRTVVFVHGCFWHRHPRCSRATTPATNQEYWLPKFERTVVRDQRIQAELRALGWNVIVVWECELKDIAMIKNRLIIEIAQPKSAYYPTDAVLSLAAEERSVYEPDPKKNQKKIKQL
jgi:DNA mismatch endonuclease (patch repair protein)